jgi:signal transduction histidine kinase
MHALTRGLRPEVRFKNNGLDSIEVQDNGSGIAPEDFDTIGTALSHSRVESVLTSISFEALYLETIHIR